MKTDTAQQVARTAGLVTAPTGVALLAAPQVAGIAGLSAAASRAIGAVDLVVAAGLLAARPKWPWAAARSAANVVTAAALTRTGTRIGRTSAVALIVLTGVDAIAARSLRAARR